MIMTNDELLTTTRAVRKRLDLDRPVDLMTIATCLRIAMQAPTGGSIERARFIVIDDDGLKGQIAGLYRSATMAAFENSLDRAGRESTKKAYEGAIELAGKLERVPVLVLFCMKGRLASSEPFQQAAYFGSIFPMIWSFQLALRSRGLGSVITTAHLRMEKDFAELLGIPFDDYGQVALVPVAYTRGLDFRPAQRKSLAEVGFLNGWGNRWTG